jgi:hypothetical protein
MSRIEVDQIEGDRAAATVNAVFTTLATESAQIDGTNLSPEGIDGRVLEDRPVWYRLDTLAKDVRNSATLAAVVPPAWATLDHYGAGAVGTGLLRFNFAAFALGANEAIRFGHWGSWETTLSSGLGVEGDVFLRWEYAGAQLAGAIGKIDRAAGATTPILQHGQHYIEGWIVGPTTVNGNVTVQYAYGSGGDAFLTRSLTWCDFFRRYNT